MDIVPLPKRQAYNNPVEEESHLGLGLGLGLGGGAVPCQPSSTLIINPFFVSVLPLFCFWLLYTV